MGLARRRPASGVALGGQAGFSPEAADALSGQSPTGEPRRSAVVSIQIISPWQPSPSQRASRPAAAGVAEAGAMPQATKPSPAACAFKALTRSSNMVNWAVHD